jgi:starch synthase
MDFHWKNEYVGIFKAEIDGIKYYFIATNSTLME